MKKLFIKKLRLDYLRQYINMQRCQPNFLAILLLTGSLLLLTTACDEEGGDIRNEIALPTDSLLNLSCAEVGINTETCVLDDPANPYAIVNVTDTTKFELNDAAPSAKARFYLWATALARSPTGENQYFTALSLHELFAENGSPLIQEQAKKAYRSVLDNFFLSSTFFLIPTDSGDVFIAAALKDIVGGNLYDPTSANLVSLYIDPVFALSDLSEWGYIYDTTNKVMSIRQ